MGLKIPNHIVPDCKSGTAVGNPPRISSQPHQGAASPLLPVPIFHREQQEFRNTGNSPLHFPKRGRWPRRRPRTAGVIIGQ